MTIFADIQYYFCWRRVSGWVRKSPKMFWLSIRMVPKRKKKVILKKPQIQTTTIYTHQQTRTTNCWNIWKLNMYLVQITYFISWNWCISCNPSTKNLDDAWFCTIFYWNQKVQSILCDVIQQIFYLEGEQKKVHKRFQVWRPYLRPQCFKTLK